MLPPSAPAIYQMKVAFFGINPMIWRRLLVHLDTSIADFIADLHHILQQMLDLPPARHRKLTSKTKTPALLTVLA